MKTPLIWQLEKYFYSDIEDERFLSDLEMWKKLYKSFKKTYKNLFHTFHTFYEVLQFYEDYSQMIQILEKPMYYLYYRSMQDMSDQKIAQKYEEIRIQYEKYIQGLDFIEAWWVAIWEEKLKKFFQEEKLLPYKNDIKSIIRNLPHLKEKIKKKDKSMKSMNVEKIRVEYQKVQNSANTDEEKTQQISDLYKKLCLVWQNEWKEWGYSENPLAVRNIQEQLPDDFVDFFLKVVQKYIPIYQEFQKNSSESIEPQKYPLEEIVKKYTQTFSLFEMRKTAKKILLWGQVDSQVAENKFPWAFTSYQYNTPSFTLLQYHENISSVFTLVHEMWHALHGTFSQIQKAPVYHTPFCVAETASILSEIFFFDQNFSENKEAKKYFTNSLFTAIFYQLQITLFEIEAHKSVKYEKYDFSEIWKKESKKVSWQEWNPNYWTQIGHIFYNPFYCYSYIFGAISAVSIFLKYKKWEISPEQIQEFYSLGNSLAPIEILQKYGIDMKNTDTYEKVFEYLQEISDM